MGLSGGDDGPTWQQPGQPTDEQRLLLTRSLVLACVVIVGGIGLPIAAILTDRPPERLRPGRRRDVSSQERISRPSEFMRT
jgi:hypothetical protein